jgi:hypothetical protein
MAPFGILEFTKTTRVALSCAVDIVAVSMRENTTVFIARLSVFL